MLYSQSSPKVGGCLGGQRRKAERAEGRWDFKVKGQNTCPQRVQKSNWANKCDSIIFSYKLHEPALFGTQKRGLLKEYEGAHVIKGKSQGQIPKRQELGGLGSGLNYLLRTLFLQQISDGFSQSFFFFFNNIVLEASFTYFNLLYII